MRSSFIFFPPRLTFLNRQQRQSNERDSAPPSRDVTKSPLTTYLDPKELGWSVLATSGTVEYFHTGNLVDVLSEFPSKATAEEKRDDTTKKNDGNSLFFPPPEELSVSLYLESDPDQTMVILAVPRWFSDGEVWEVR